MDRMAQEVLSLRRVLFEPIPGCPAPFSGVAGDAGTHEIPWRVITLFCERLNVVERQLIVGEYLCAIDAAEGIAGKNRRALVVSRL